MLESEIPLAQQKAKIRLARLADAHGLRALYNDVYQGKYPLKIITDREEMQTLLKKENYFWFAAEASGKIVGSVIFCVDPQIKLAKAFGAVVHPDYRGADLTERMMALGIRLFMKDKHLASSVYATTRTVGGAAQHLTKKIGFRELGIFPNVRKVDNYETHGLAAYFDKNALNYRFDTPRLPLILKPFYEITQKAVGIADAQWHDLEIKPPSPYSGHWLEFKVVDAKRFIESRWKELKAAKKLAMDFFPFHEPNLLLATKDGSLEAYLYHSQVDHHAVLMGLTQSEHDLTHILNSAVLFLEESGVRYLELVTDAYHPHVIKKIMEARFLPSAYYPAMAFSEGKLWDYMAFSKSFVLLDFKNIVLTGLYRDYLKEYFRLWKAFYIEDAF